MKKPVTVARQRAVVEKVEEVAATITFTGDPRGKSDPENPEYGGKAFPKDKPVDVGAEWLAANPNILKNDHFKVENLKEKAAE